VYIHQNPHWPGFTWNSDKLAMLMAQVRHRQGKMLGKMEALGFAVQTSATLDNLTLEVVKSSEIEGEILDADQVRSSIAQRLGIDQELPAIPVTDRHVEGVVEMMLDATSQFYQPLTEARLFSWHAAMFPTGRSGMQKITVGSWRTGIKGPMRVVSGAIGREQVHFEAPDASRLSNEMALFLNWFNSEPQLDPVLKAGIAHLWFVTIHPFEDGNGRIARAITELQLARADQTAQRFYSMSAQIRKERLAYYQLLETTQKGSLDITAWLEWFLHCLGSAFDAVETTVQQVNQKTAFWNKVGTTALNHRQRLMLNKLLDGFEGKLNTSKWAKLTNCSQDSALRDIQDLLDKDLLQKTASGGRSTSYVLT
jgi:Fic family protein